MAASDQPAPSSPVSPHLSDTPAVLFPPSATAVTGRPGTFPALWQGRLSRGLDAALASAVLAFAFLVASFAVRNGDFWQHLAAGRLLADGQYRFGEDPFAYTTAGTYWANHAWLFDLALYGLYQAAGGASLVVLKALAVAGLAGLMLSIRRPGAGAWLAAACTTLALLTMAPGLLLRPAVASCVLLGLALWLLARPHLAPARQCENGDSPPRPGGLSPFSHRLRPGLLLGLFVLWVNVDSWFLLGPLLVALFWLGERLGGSSRHTPGWLVPAGLAVCLVNPHHVHAFTLPLELSPAVWASDLPQDARLEGLFQSPWQLGDYLRPSAGLNAAGLSYFVLLFLGVVSFAAGRVGLRDWRLPVWLVFAVLSAWQLAAVPFFAVVAGPVTVLNLQDALASRRAVVAPSGWGRLALLLVILALAGLCWPGWLQAVPHERRRVAWEVQPDPSLQRAVERLRRWREQGVLAPDQRVFATHPDVAHYCAWFAPGEKGFLDHRLPLFLPVAQPYATVCQALGSVADDEDGPSDEWRQVLRDHRVGALVLCDSDPQRVFAGLHRLVQDPRRAWTLQGIDGRVAVFALRQTGEDEVAPRLPETMARLAFGSGGEDEALPAAPDEGPARPPRRRNAWEQFARPPLPVAWESPAATLYLRAFEERADGERREQHLLCFGRYAVRIVGLAAPGLGPWETSTWVVLPLQWAGLFLMDRDDRPPELPLLAVRAARRAVVANPDDANAWLRLGQAYLVLYRMTGERHADAPREQHWQLLEVLRHIQAATALENALKLNPDLEPAHRGLAELYAERAYLDLALEHGQEALRLARRGLEVGAATEEQRARLEDDEKRVEALEQLVRDRRNEFTIRARPLTADPLGRARLAVSLGLARVALDDVLWQSSVQLFKGEGARMELELMLMLGRAFEVRPLLDDEELQKSREALGEAELPAPLFAGYPPSYRLPSYDWLRFYQAAATGDYTEAYLKPDSPLRNLVERLETMERADRHRREHTRRNLPAMVASEVGAAAPPAFLPARFVLGSARERAQHYLADEGRSVLFPRLLRADLNTLGGLLALEQGRVATAADFFRAAAVAGGNDHFVGRPLASAYLQRIEAARRGRPGR